MFLTVNNYIGWHRSKVEEVKPVQQNIVSGRVVSEIEKIQK